MGKILSRNSFKNNSKKYRPLCPKPRPQDSLSVFDNSDKVKKNPNVVNTYCIRFLSRLLSNPACSDRCSDCSLRTPFCQLLIECAVLLSLYINEIKCESMVDTEF